MEMPISPQIIFENQHYVVANKPTGLIVHPSVDKNRPHLQGMLESQLGGEKLVLAHRLDRDTSGIVLFLRSVQSKKLGPEIFLQKKGEERGTEKIYWALVRGSREDFKNHLEGEWAHFLSQKKEKNILKSFVVQSGGDKAILKYKWMGGDADTSLLECHLITGRMHQIRAQCSHQGFPLIGDELYGGGSGTFFLHARQLSFVCPVENKRLDFISPMPANWPGWVHSLDIRYSL